MNFKKFVKSIIKYEKNLKEKASKHLTYEFYSHNPQDDLEDSIEIGLTYLNCINDLLSISEKYKNRHLGLEEHKLPENKEEWNNVFRQMLSELERYIQNIDCLIYLVKEPGMRAGKRAGKKVNKK